MTPSSSMLEPHLSEYSMNNRRPPETILREVEALLEVPVKEVSEIEDACFTLEVRLKELKERRKMVQEKIGAYYLILSPARRLPSDILREIFSHCLPVHRNSAMSAEEAPVLLTHICSSWRSIALSSPRLWTRLHILLGLKGCQWIERRNPPHILWRRDEFTRAMQIRCDALEDWFARAGKCSLSLSVVYADLSPSEETQLLQGAAEIFAIKTFTVLLRYTCRWEALDLSLPFHVYKMLDDRISPPHLLNLRKLRVCLVDHQRGIQGHYKFWLTEAPGLHTISLLTGHPGIQIADSSSASWSQLSYLAWHEKISTRQLFTFLKHCPNLIGCNASISWDHANTSHSELDELPGVVILPNLKSLSMLDSTTTANMTTFFKSVRAPSLTWLQYIKTSSRVYDPWHDWNIDTPQPPALLSLLESSTTIKKLIFFPVDFLQADIHKCLQLCKNVTYMVLGEESRPSLTDSGSRRAIPSRTQNRFDLSKFTIGSEHTSSSSSSNPEDILLRNLEILEAHQLTGCDDENLLLFLKSRIDAAGRGAVSTLKAVNISFGRKREVDIVPEISQYARAAGIDLELNLTYLTEVPDEPSSLHGPPYVPVREDGRMGWEGVEILE